MVNRNPEWPGSLPLPSQIRYGPSGVHLVQADLAASERVDDLVHDLYWQPDSVYFLFVPALGGLDARLHDELRNAGVEMREIDLYFYPHPSPAYPNDFIQLLPHEVALDWQHRVVRGPMYQRMKLSLHPGVRENMSHVAIAAKSREAITASESMFELKPNFYGLGLNLAPLLRRIRAWFGRRV